MKCVIVMRLSCVSVEFIYSIIMTYTCIDFVEDTYKLALSLDLVTIFQFGETCMGYLHF